MAVKDKFDLQTRSKNMATIRSTGNKTTELRLRMFLTRAGVSGWKLLPANVIGKPDFVFPEMHLAIFVYGCFWHGCPKCYQRPVAHQSYWDAKLLSNRRRDQRLRAQLRRDGWSVMRIWEHELKHSDQVIRRIQRMVGRKTPDGA